MTKASISLQNLRRRIYVKAKTEGSWRFWGLYVHVCKEETLREAYRRAKANNGAAGVDGVTFAEIEASGKDAFLERIRLELVERTYKPGRTRRVAIPKPGSKKLRWLSIPAIRDRVVQCALKLILEPIFEADFQEGSFGYRPKKTSDEAVQRVARAIIAGKRHVIDVDLESYFDNVRQDLLIRKVAMRVNDDDVMRLLRLVMRASGKRGVPQGSPLSPLLSNLYLNEVDKMLERAKEVTRDERGTVIEYVRFADDIVVLVHTNPRHRWLYAAVARRLHEELSKLEVKVNEEKTRTIDLKRGESFGYLGFQFQWVRGRRGKHMVLHTPQIQKRTALLRKLKPIFRRFESRPTKALISRINPIIRGWVNYFAIGHSSRCFSYVRQWVEKRLRRHLARARKKRKGFGWKRWSSDFIYGKLGLFDGYRTRWNRKHAQRDRSHNPWSEASRSA
jgi:RNA-directed DNA polymerase